MKRIQSFSRPLLSPKRLHHTNIPNPNPIPSLLAHKATAAAPLDIHPEVAHALATHQPVVALETALVTNGVAPPTNLSIARELEAIVRKQGAVPATVGVIGGRVKVGLRDEELVRLADTEGNKGLVKVCAAFVLEGGGGLNMGERRGGGCGANGKGF